MQPLKKLASFKPRLYSFWSSSCAWRVRIVMALKKLEYEYVPINLLAGVQKEDGYTSKNPMKEVPALEISEDQILAQSMAIIEYLEEQFTDVKVLPSNPVDRAIVRQMAEIITSGIQPLQNLRVLQKLEEKTKDKEYRHAWGKFWVENGLTAFEKLVLKHGGKYAFGDSITLVDVVLVPQMFNARRFNCDLTLFPTLVELDKRLSEEDAFKQAHPDQQPDCPKRVPKKEEEKMPPKP